MICLRSKHFTLYRALGSFVRKKGGVAFEGEVVVDDLVGGG
jgi:hypothetical protein